ncbi:MAG: dockerin type I repeat-containing protein [Euryarchaeota archaeon]|nr:dockerin type I repeat-containing protein [Euryarchaeota archaeon]
MKRIIAIACMLVLLAPMPALAADLVIEAPDKVLKGEQFVITVKTAEGAPVGEAAVQCSIGGAQHHLVPTNADGITTFNATVTGELLITAQKSGDTGNKTILVVESMVTGDLNGDNILTTADAAIALQMAVGARTPSTAADVSGDGSVTSLDTLMILQAARGAITL